MTPSSLLLRGGTVIGSDRATQDDVLLRDGRVEEVDRFVEEYDAVEEVGGKLLFPGLVDCHVHFREPGLTHKATMQSEAAASVAGGVTTVCEMPNTVPPTVTVAALADKVRRAEEIDGCDMRFFFGVTEAAHIETLRELFTGESAELRRLRARCAGVKIYFDHSTGNQKIDTSLLDAVFAVCAEKNIVLVAHCEDAETNAQAGAQNVRSNIAVHSLLRPAQSEVVAVERAVALARTHGTRLHIAHLSTEGGVDLVRVAKTEGLSVTCEVAPHHLFFTTEDYELYGTRIKMNPPVRSHKHRAALWQGIIDRTIDCIATDHAPHTLEEKNNTEPLAAPSGVPGVETMLPLLLSVAGGKWPHPAEPWASCPPFTYSDIVRLCCSAPSRIFRLGKSEIQEDQRTDIVIVDPATEWVLRGEELHSLCKWTPYDGWVVRGKVERVISADKTRY